MFNIPTIVPAPECRRLCPHCEQVMAPLLVEKRALTSYRCRHCNLLILPNRQRQAQRVEINEFAK